MKKSLTFVLLLSVAFISFGQKDIIKNIDGNTNNTLQGNSIVHPNVIKTPVGFAISGPLNKINLTDVDIQFINNEPNPFIGHEDREIQPGFTVPDYDDVYKDDTGMQLDFGTVQNSKGITHNYNGQTSGSFPPDCNGDVGPVYYFQTVNLTYSIYNKATGVVAANGNLNSIFNSSLPGAGYNDGDPIVLWDEQANKWLYVEFSISGSNDYMLIAVSQTADPTGSWYSWSFDVDDTPDYMKFGIWQDGYYMATNTSGGNDVYVFERDVMIAGGPSPQMIAFSNPSRPSTFDGFHCIMPLDNDGPWAPAGTPGGFITIADDGQGNSADELRIYECVTDWTTPANSTFAMTQQLPVNSFAGEFDAADWNNIPQPGTTQQLDGISTVLMYRAQYRNFSGTEKIVCTHTIAETGTEGAIRWYILERNGGNWSINQQGTYNPGGADDVSRWLPSIAMNGAGQVAIGFSTSSPTNTTYPGIHVIGRSTCAPANTMDIAEFSIVEGGTYQSTYERWGDYANMSVDPSDDYTFWFTT